MRNFFSLNFLYILLIAAESAAIIFLCIYIPALLPAVAVFVGAWLASVIAVIAVAARGGSPEINCALSLLIIALPVVGAVIFALSHIGGKEYGTLTLENAEPQGGLESAAFECCGVCGAGYDRAEYFTCGEDYFKRLFKEIEKAEKRVCLEYFIVCRGKIFSRLLAALRNAKNNGAEIKIIVDGIGSAFKAGRREMKKLKTVGAEVKVFHRLKPLIYSRINYRDHRKIAAIDGKVAFTGGINIADEYANIDSPHGYWKDTGVAVYGAAAEVFEGMFLAVWNKSYKTEISGSGKHRCLPFYDSPPHRAGFCENAYAAAINSARERVHIFTPYFCATDKNSPPCAGST